MPAYRGDPVLNPYTQQHRTDQQICQSQRQRDELTPSLLMGSTQRLASARPATASGRSFHLGSNDIAKPWRPGPAEFAPAQALKPPRRPQALPFDCLPEYSNQQTDDRQRHRT